MSGIVPNRPPLVLKFGGELLDDRAALQCVVGTVARIAARGEPLVIVHGGGKEIDAALTAAGIEKRQVDGLRVTDAGVAVTRTAGNRGAPVDQLRVEFTFRTDTSRKLLRIAGIRAE